MRAVIQRVSNAHVVVDHAIVGAINRGYVVLLAVTHNDTLDHVRMMAEKILNLRIFPDEQGKFDRSVRDVGGGVLVISQFTLYADTRKGRRPSFIASAQPNHARPLIDAFVQHVADQGIHVATGEFGAHMDVTLTNDGPVTIMLDTDDWGAARG
ncbi:MAG: D-tyrosyl-tRNA(Tyr) deacylase [Herpetosiphon sp.]|nr:D-tyrosyl-tRNA(Tyr) deacylase [Herpetosiphon sp.]